MTAEQATNNTWLCNELSGNMAYTTQACEGIGLIESSGSTTEFEKRTIATDGLDRKRNAKGRWSWVLSGAHLASQTAMEILQRSLQNDLYESFNKSPRSWCNAYNGVTACISWSAVEDWNHYYAQEMVGDALSVVDFNKKSAQANGVLSSRKRSTADVCLSNRAKGCT